VPKTGKNRTQQPPNADLPEQAAQEQGDGVHRPHIPPADAEGKKKPAVKKRRDKKAVRKGGVFWPQGTKKPVEDSQHRPGQQP